MSKAIRVVVAAAAVCAGSSQALPAWAATNCRVFWPATVDNCGSNAGGGSGDRAFGGAFNVVNGGNNRQVSVKLFAGTSGASITALNSNFQPITQCQINDPAPADATTQNKFCFTSTPPTAFEINVD